MISNMRLSFSFDLWLYEENKKCGRIDAGEERSKLWMNKRRGGGVNTGVVREAEGTRKGGDGECRVRNKYSTTT